MSIKEKILSDLKIAMKSGDNLKRDSLRLLDSAIKNSEIEKKKREEGLNDEEIIEIVARSIKQRKDSIEQYKKGGREDLAEKEQKEIEIFSVYLPTQMSEEEVRVAVKSVISSTGASSKKDMGKVMGKVMAEVKGKTDGTLVKKIVESELGE